MNVYRDFEYYTGGIYSYTGGSSSQNPFEGGHAIELIGYDHNNQYFIVKNSWGTGWGTSDPNGGSVTTPGFFLIAYSQIGNVVQFGGETIAYTGYSQDPCSYSIASPTSVSVPYTAVTNATEGVTSTSGCKWTAASNNPSWLSIVSGASGTGNGTVTYSVSANSATTQRVGTLTIAGQTFTVTQAPTAPSGSLKVTITPSGAVTAGAMWSVNGGTSWNASGTTVSGIPVGNYTLTFKSVTGWNTPTSQSVSIANASTTTASGVYVQQTGSLTVTITPSTAVTAGAMWSVNGGTSWNASGAKVSGLVVGNYTLTFKTVMGWATPANQSVTITNGGNATASGVYGTCSYSLSSKSASPSYIGGIGSVNVTSTSGCPWTATSNAGWITIISGASGTGNGTVTYSVSMNTAYTSRTGTLTIGGQTFTVTQAAHIIF
jgi:hypothetical protein